MTILSPFTTDKPFIGLRNEFLGGTSVGGFNPRSLFSASEPGVWYDPSDVANLNWRYNLLTYTEQFDNAAWFKLNNTVLANSLESPFGVAASAIIPNVGTFPILVFRASLSVLAGQTYTFSCYAKRGTLGNFFEISMEGRSFFSATNAVFNLEDGTITSKGTGTLSSTIQSVGNGWYRCAVTAIVSSSGSDTYIYFLPRTSSSTRNVTGDGVSVLTYLWGAQLELGTTASPYQRISDVNTEVRERFPTATLYQDTAGTTPVTAAGQSVALLRDKSGRGNHATQATAASRPIYSVVPQTGRRNLLTYTEQFDNVAWTRHDSLTTVNSVSFSSSDISRIYQPVSSITSSSVTMSVRFANSDAGKVVRLAIWATGLNGLTDGASPNLTIPESGIISYTWTSVTNLNICGILNSSTGGAKTVTLASSRGAQLELGSTATAYQRVVSQYDVTEAGVPSLHYLSFDGTDDFLVTPTITPGTDKAQVFAGVRKLSDAAFGMLAELSISDSNNGVFYIGNQANGILQFLSKGTSSVFADGATAFPAPTSLVVTGLGDISGDIATVRVGGVTREELTTNQGTGNYLAYPLYIGRRGGAYLPFNGHLYSLMVRFGPNLSTPTIQQTEAWVGGKTGFNWNNLISQTIYDRFDTVLMDRAGDPILERT